MAEKMPPRVSKSLADSMRAQITHATIEKHVLRLVITATTEELKAVRSLMLLQQGPEPTDEP